MSSPRRVVAETDCCGNLYLVDVPAPSRRTDTLKPSVVAMATALAVRIVWTLTLCDWSGTL